MKTIVRNGTNASLYLLSDETLIDVQSDRTLIGDPLELIVQDCNQSNVTVYEGVPAPDAWRGGKYLFDGQAWAINPEWVEPVSDGLENL